MNLLDGMGQFDTTENFLATDIDSLGVIDLPNGWTSAGGQAELRLVIAQLDIDNNEELILYSFPCRLLFEGRDTGTGTTQANLETGLSGLIADTVEVKDAANLATQNANTATGLANNATGYALEKGNYAGQMADTAQDAASLANTAATKCRQ